jgi:hypothetical protein
MLFLTLALVSASPTCTDIRQQCRACPTDGKHGCSSVGIACQPVRRVCAAAAPAKARPHADRAGAAAAGPR